MSRSQKHYLLEMDDARTFVEDVAREDRKNDRRTRYALQRTFEIIGEATKNLDDDLRVEYDDVPWDEMAGMRDVIVHKYFAVNLEVIWQTIHDDIPSVQPRLREILDEMSDEESTL